MNQTSLGIAAETAGQWVPIRELERNQRRLESMPDFVAWIKNQSQWIEQEHRADESMRQRKWLKNHRFYEGRQLGYISNFTGRWVDVDPKPGDPYYVNNQYRFYVKSVTKEWVRSNSELLVNAKTDDPKDIDAARAAKMLLQEYQRKCWPAELRQREAKFAILTGNYFRYSYWSSAIGEQMQMPIMEDMPVEVGQGSFNCTDCGTTGYADSLQSGAGFDQGSVDSSGQSEGMDQQTGSMGQGMSSGVPAQAPMPADPSSQPPQLMGQDQGMGYSDSQGMSCPGCGSPNVQHNPPPTVNVPQQTGSFSMPSGDIITETVDPMEMKLHLHARTLKESPYLRRRRLVLKQVIEATFPWVAFTPGNTANNTGLRFQEDLELSPGNITVGGVRSNFSETSTGINPWMCEFNQIWLDPVLYASYTAQKDEQFGNGMIIPTGTPFTELFPTGMYIALVGDIVVDIRDENKDDHWCHGVYDLIPTRIWGDGSEDGVEQQRQLNEIDSLMFENIMNCDAPMTIYNPLKIKRGQISGKPREVVPLNNALLTDEPEKYFWQPPPRPLPAEVPMKMEQIKKDMQAMFGAFNLEAGLPGVDVKTATGMSIVRDAAISLLAVPLELKSAVDVIWGLQILKLLQKHWVGSRFIPMLGPYGEPAGQWFSSADIDTEFEITVQQHSWVPRNELELRNDILEALVAGGLPLGIFNPQFPREVRPIISRRLNIPFDADGMSLDMRNQRLEIEQIKMGVQIAMQNGIDPIMFTLSEVPVSPWVDEHMAHIEAIKNYLKSDAGRAELPPIKDALLAHLQSHLEAKMQVDMQMNMLTMMSMGGPMGAPGAPGQPGAGPGGPPSGPGGQPPPGKGGPGGQSKQQQGQGQPAAPTAPPNTPSKNKGGQQ